MSGAQLSLCPIPAREDGEEGAWGADNANAAMPVAVESANKRRRLAYASARESELARRHEVLVLLNATRPVRLQARKQAVQSNRAAAR